MGIESGTELIRKFLNLGKDQQFVEHPTTGVFEVPSFHSNWSWIMPALRGIAQRTGYVYVMYDYGSYFTKEGDNQEFGGGWDEGEYKTFIAIAEFIWWWENER